MFPFPQCKHPVNKMNIIFQAYRTTSNSFTKEVYLVVTSVLVLHIKELYEKNQAIIT